MTIRNDSVVEIEYTLKNDAGEVIDSSADGDSLHYLHGHGNIVPGLERALSGKKKGDSVNVVVAPEDGYGKHEPARVMDVSRTELPDDLDPEVGMMLAMRTPDGQTVPLTITEVSDTEVKVDANHPLAGETLHFDVMVKAVRDATAEELAHGHVHGPGEHAH